MKINDGWEGAYLALATVVTLRAGSSSRALHYRLRCRSGNSATDVGVASCGFPAAHSSASGIGTSMSCRPKLP